jgi:hypothetical protein
VLFFSPKRVNERAKEARMIVAISTLSPEERISEIAEILAEGLMRLRSRQSSKLSPDRGECSLHIPAHQRDVTVTCLETAE